MAAELVSYLRSTPASNIATHPLLVGAGNDSLADLLELMISNSVTSLPIFDEGKQKFIGMVDNISIVGHFAKGFSNIPEENREEYFKNFNFHGAKIKDIPELLHCESAGTVSEESSLFEVMDMLKSFRRVYLEDSEGNAKSVVSQKILLNHLHKRLAQHPLPCLEKPLSAMVDCSGQVVFIREDSTALDAYRLMWDEKVSGVPILDNDNHILSNLSSGDLRACRWNSGFLEFSALLMNAVDFLRVSRSHDMNVKAPSIACSVSTPLAQAITKLVATKVHRLYIKAENSGLAGVLSLTDVLTALWDDLQAAQ
eukprot:CAMPEP_0177660790 /NCGR_PEP_ID=MMETSP0447-20121125/18258_1 /TAXON_ID=0 /ORGANISM="Stygamoeba regulata, Strain BSH-02190019" /LENGTH=310 /DNA_ID=CAMNT_0019165939 /DNA_START=32 /DNA_END=964 /DNA_ORIENTATION=+